MTDLTPEERKKVYEEEKTRIETSQSQEKERNKVPKRRREIISSSSYSIAICLILLIGFIFFNKYIAFYRPDFSSDTLVWVKEQILTSAFNTWLIILIVGLVLVIAGHICIIILKNYVWQELILIITNLVGIGVIVALFYMYPFDFSTIQDKSWTGVVPIIINIILGLIILVMAISVLVKGIRLIISVTTKVYNE